MKFQVLQDLIKQKLNLNTRFSDVLEYTLLEKANVLGEFKNSGLLCFTKPDSHSNLILKDGESTSVIVFGFNIQSKAQEIQLNNIGLGIQNYIPQSYDDREAQYYITYNQQRSFIISNSSIKDAIESSSLVKASGNIDNLSVNKLNTLKKGVLLYQVNTSDKKLTDLVNELSSKIELIVEKKINSRLSKTSQSDFFKSSNALNQLYTAQVHSNIVIPAIKDLTNLLSDFRPKSGFGLPILTNTIKDIQDLFATIELKDAYPEKNVKQLQFVMEKAEKRIEQAVDQLEKESYSKTTTNTFILDILRSLADVIKTCLHYITFKWANKTTEWTTNKSKKEQDIKETKELVNNKLDNLRNTLSQVVIELDHTTSTALNDF